MLVAALTPDANRILGWDSGGTGLMNYPTSTAAYSSDLGLATVGKGASLIGRRLNAANSLPRTQDDVNNERISLLDFVSDNTGATTVTTQIGYALAYASTAKRKIWIPNGTYKGAWVLNSSAFKGMMIEGESKDGVILLAPDNSTSVIALTNGAHGVHLKNLTIQAGLTPTGSLAERNAAKANNNGTHYGIYTKVANTVYEDITVAYFNNNLHFIGNENRLIKVISVEPVYGGAAATGCGFFATSIGGGGPGLWFIDCADYETTTANGAVGKYGWYIDTIDAPYFANCQSLNAQDTGIYATNSGGPGVYSVGPQFANVGVDSSLVQGVYLSNMIYSAISNLWISSRGKGLVMYRSSFNSIDVMSGGNTGTAIEVQGGSSHNSFAGKVVVNTGIGIYCATGSTTNTFTGMFIQGNGGDAIYIQTGSSYNSFNGCFIDGNTGKGFNFLDTTAGSPNSLNHSSWIGNSGGYTIQPKDIITNAMDGGGNTYSLGYASGAITGGNTGGSNLWAAGNITGCFDFVMPRSGSLISLSVALNTTLTAGVLAFYPTVNGVGFSTLQCQITTGTPQYAIANVVPGVVPFAAGDRVRIFWAATGATLTTSPCSVSASLIVRTQ